uniref:G-protein coupled receptors family 1 profile domain-containing protein n=1 Tax=Ciona intestinalis TaxID=7719 RepID=F6RI63_CIOIN
VDTIVYIILEVLLGVLSIFGNALVCYVVLHSRTLRKKVMYMFVTSLAVADICVGAIAIPFAILTKLGLPRSSPFLCVSMLSFIMIPTQISIFNLMAISVERYLSIRHPRIHYNKLTVDKSLTVVVLTWIVSVVIGMLPLFGWNKISNPPGKQPIPVLKRFSIILQSRATNSTPTVIPSPKPSLDQCEFMQVMDFDYMFFNFAACVLPPLITSAILYFIIFVLAVMPKLNELSVKAAKKRSHNERHVRRVREMRAAVVLALIVLSFAICWMPIHILNTIHRFDPSRVIPAYVYNVAILLSHCNSTVNFFLYSWRLKAFRIHLHKRVLNKLKRND